MQFQYTNFLRGLLFLARNCLRCGGGPCQDHTVFCSSCWQKLDLNLAMDPIELNPQVHLYALLKWNNHNHEIIKALVLALKGGHNLSTWNRLALEFVLRFHWSDGHSRKSPNFVCIPSQTGEERDHSWAWAMNLCNLVGGTCAPVLARVGELAGPQKLKSKADRKSIQFARLPGVKLAKNQVWIVSDDVVTSGATAIAAWEALGRPQKLQVWALAYRSSLRDTP